MRHSVCFAFLAAFLGAVPVFGEDPLPSWNDGPSRAAIVTFVENVTKENSPGFVPVSERIAVFDNDGTLWSESPVYFQLLFAIDRVKQLAESHPEWKQQQPFQAVLENDRQELLASGKKGLLTLMMATHAGMTTDEFSESVREWLRTARHPRFNRPYSELVYQPMLELLSYLRANGFTTYIVSGGGIEFIRVFSEEVYGIPPQQVIGSSIQTQFEIRDGQPVIVRLPQLDFIDDKEGKPVAINKFIGRRPLAAFGNSDGDLQMLQWTDARPEARFCMIVHHTDADREWAYDRLSHVGKLDVALEMAAERGWTVVDMKSEWKTVFPGE